MGDGRRRAARVAIAALIGGGAIVLAPSLPAHAAVVTVTMTNDVKGVKDSGCAAFGTPPCSLRQAVQYANDHAGTTISIPPGTYELVLADGSIENEAADGDLDIRESTKLVGTGGAAATTIVRKLSASAKSDRVFDVAPHSGAITVSISGVTVSGGVADDDFGGGGLWVGGHTDLTIRDSVFIDNHSFDPTGGGGIGVVSPATVLLERIRLQGNGSTRTPGSGDTFGGGLAVGGSVRVADSVFDGNTVFGGLSIASGVTGGDGEGGAIAVGLGGSLQLDRSLLIGNEAHGGSSIASGSRRGGDGRGGAVRAIGTFTMTNSTVTKNIAVGGDGESLDTGGIGNGGGIVMNGGTILNSTIADNSAVGGQEFGGRQTSSGGGGSFVTSTVRNTIIAGNHRIPADSPFEVDLEAFGSDTDGHNLFGVTRDATLRQPTNLFGTAAAPLDAKLAAQVTDNGGPTSTLALLPGSPAINAADDAVCAAGAGGTDQRGVVRPQPLGGHCDIGAFEYEFVSSAIALTSSANPSAIGQAVTFNATVSATGGSPTGTVTIRDGASNIGGGTLAGGVVSVTTAALSPGTHSISATYEGDTIFASSTATLTQNVGGPGVGGGTGMQFFPLPKPVRLLDTRAGHQAFVAPSAPLIANQPLSLPGRFTVDGVTVPSSALALVGNATVDNTAGVPAGFATLWPSGSPLPLASNLNFVPGTVRPNSFTVGLGADGQFELLSNTGGDFIVDITGYFAPPSNGGLYFHPLAQPVRLLDTRAGATAIVTPGAALTAGQTLHVQGQFTAAGGSVPATAKALVGNATVDNRVGALPGFATLYPGGTPLPPTSNLNFVAGTIAPNAFTVALGTDGSFDLFSNTGGDFIVDVSGYYDDQPSSGLLFSALATPVRELDTRAGFAAVVHPNAPVSAGTSSNLPGSFTGGDVTVPASATALVGNATVDNSINGADGFATLYPGGGSLPLASNLNYTLGLIAPNAFVVGIGPDHTYNLFSQSTTNFIIDISGYFAPA